MSDRQRRVFGFWVGVAFGLPYLIVSQFINVWALPGVPLFDFPVGRVESIVIGTVVFGLMGLIIGWHEESLLGILIGALFAVIIGSIGAFLNSGSSDTLRSLFVFIFTFLPRVILYIPLGILFRWVINTRDSLPAHSAGWLRRSLTAWVVLLATAIIGARFSIYRPEARQALQDANVLVQQGMKVQNPNDLPAPLIPVEGFAQYAKGPYTLEWSADVDVLPVTRPQVSMDVIESLIIVRYDNGFQFGCVYTPPRHDPKCIDIHVPR